MEQSRFCANLNDMRNMSAAQMLADVKQFNEDNVTGFRKTFIGALPDGRVEEVTIENYCNPLTTDLYVAVKALWTSAVIRMNSLGLTIVLPPAK